MAGSGLPTVFAQILTSWVLTYLLHSTVVLGGVWLATRRGPLAVPRHRTVLWRTAAIAAVLTATVQIWPNIAQRGAPNLQTMTRIQDGRSLLEGPGRVVWQESVDVVSASATGGAHRQLRVGIGHVGTSSYVGSNHELEVAGGHRATPAIPPSFGLRTAGSEGQRVSQVCRDAMGRHLDAIQESERVDFGSSPRTSGGPQTVLPGGPLGEDVEASRRVLLDACQEQRRAILPWILLGLWFGGAGLGLIRLCRQQRAFRRAITPSCPAGDRVRGLLQDLVPEKTRLHRRVTAFEATGLRGPVALYGNRVGLPPRATLHLDEEELRAVLAHELGHIIRRDPGWLVVLRVVESVLWIQPLNRVARGEFQTSAELLADEWALQRTNGPLGLARSLEKVAGWMVEVETSEPVLAMARAESPIVDRVRRILRYSDRSTPRSLRSLSAALLLPAFLLPPAPLTARAEFRILIFEEATDVGDHAPVAMPEVTRELHVEYSVTGS